MDDQQLIALYWQRDPEAIPETCLQYGSYCKSVAANILHNPLDCEECVNDTWLEAWNSMPPHKPAVLRLFLAKITRALCFNRYKALTAQKRGGGEIDRVLDELAECVGSREDACDAVIAKQLQQSINHFVRTLPQRDAGIFLRRYFFTEPVKEIARRYGITQSYASFSLSTTRKKLRKHLIQEGYLHE